MGCQAGRGCRQGWLPAVRRPEGGSPGPLRRAPAITMLAPCFANPSAMEAPMPCSTSEGGREDWGRSRGHARQRAHTPAAPALRR